MSLPVSHVVAEAEWLAQGHDAGNWQGGNVHLGGTRQEVTL